MIYPIRLYHLTKTVFVSALLFLTLAAVPSAKAQESLVVNNGPFKTNESWNCTSFSLADDFTVTTPTSISSIRFWAVDFSQDQHLSNFCGTMSWFINSDNGNSRPGQTVTSGFSSGVVVEDTGLTYSGDQIHIFQLDIPTDNVDLDAGTYWLHLKEGTPTDSSDTSPLLWLVRDGHSGAGFRFDPDPVSPTSWESDGGTEDLSFQLFSQLNAGPTEAPEPSSCLMLLLILLPYIYVFAIRTAQNKILNERGNLFNSFITVLRQISMLENSTAGRLEEFS